MANVINLFIFLVFGVVLSKAFSHEGSIKQSLLPFNSQIAQLISREGLGYNETWSPEEILINKWIVGKAVTPSYIGEFFEKLQSNGTSSQDVIDKLLVGVNSTDCQGHLIELLLRLFQIDSKEKSLRWITEEHKWAAQMIDAWGKLPEGILTGHVNSFGDFDECVQIQASNIKILNKRNADISRKFEGKYCTSYILDYQSGWGLAGRLPQASNQLGQLAKNMDVGAKKAVSVDKFLKTLLTQKPSMAMMIPSVGVCYPNSCSLLDIQNFMINAVDLAYQISLPNTKKENLRWPVVIDCRDGTPPKMDAAVIAFLTFLALLLATCLTTGVYDYWLNHGVDESELIVKTKENPKKSFVYQYFMAFSLYTNTKKWLSTRKSSDDLGCLHGIRFLSTAWVVLAHTYFVSIMAPQWNIWDLKNMWKDRSILAVINGTFSVDTFFVMSGMLATYNILKLLDKTRGKLNVPMLYIHRIIRITPTYAILIGFAATVTVYLGNGPRWNVIEEQERNCRKSWWVNFLYINNLKADNGCNSESWYLANDMQFYLLSPFIVYPIWKWRKIGLGLLGIYTILSIIAPALVVEYTGAPAAMIFTSTLELIGKANDIYIRPWSRIQTFIVGVWLGWILHETKGKTFRIPRVIAAFCWVASTGVVLTVLFAIQPWFDPEGKIPHVSGLFYAGLSRFSYAVAISWVIFACVKGYGGPVNAFLSWKAFMPLGRLCFCVYLLSLHLQGIFHAGLTVPIKFNNYLMVNLFFAHMVTSLLAGFVATMLFESPFIVLQKLLFEGRS